MGQQPPAFPPREEFTDIRVENDGSWYAKGGKKIVNRDILKYFKQGLHRDKKGIYIYNEFGPFREKGYIKVFGPVVQVADFDSKNIYLDNDDTITLEPSLKIVMDSKDRPFVYYEPLQTWAGFLRGAFFRFMDVIGHSVEETGERRFYNIPVQQVQSVDFQNGLFSQ